MLVRLGYGLAPLAARLWRLTALTTGSGTRLVTESGQTLILE